MDQMARREASRRSRPADGQENLPVPPPPQQFLGSYGGSDFPPQQGRSPQNPWSYPQGGFVNFLHHPYFPAPPQGENFHFTGLMNHVNNGVSPEQTSKGNPTPEDRAGKQARSRKKRSIVNIDDDDGVEANMAKKRWTHDEQVLLANAWLNSSNDSINGADKKDEVFWKQITEEYNKKVPQDRQRGSNQLQIYWSRLKSTINDFNGFWSTICKLHTSGYSEDQLMDEAQKLYTSKMGSLSHWFTGGGL